ncbi:extensin-like isoform X2 [Mustela erminea]|uniref:extensin-like isoform X2 n=1 Tax=Mustela erminea TaxID=36723 RepID=UPI0013866C4E|nr:extensin-like isoform X2 [Mustela erminea]
MHSSTQSWPILRTGRNPTVRERPGPEQRRRGESSPEANDEIATPAPRSDKPGPPGSQTGLLRGTEPVKGKTCIRTTHSGSQGTPTHDSLPISPASVNPGNWRPYISSSTRPPNTAWAARSTRQPTPPILCPGISLPKFSGLSPQYSSDAPPPVPRSFARSGPQNSPFRNPGTHPLHRRARAHPHTHTPTHARARVTSRRLRVSGNPPTRPPKSPLHSPEL